MNLNWKFYFHPSALNRTCLSQKNKSNLKNERGKVGRSNWESNHPWDQIKVMDCCTGVKKENYFTLAMLYCRCGLLFSASGSNLEKNWPGSDRNQFSGLHSQTCFSCFISSTHKTLYTIFNEDSANQTIKRINGTLPRAWPRRVGLLWWAEQTFKRVNRTLLRTGHRRVGRTAHIRLLHKRVNRTLLRTGHRRVGLLWWAEQTFKRVNGTLLRAGHRGVGRTAQIRL